MFLEMYQDCLTSNLTWSDIYLSLQRLILRFRLLDEVTSIYYNLLD